MNSEEAAALSRATTVDYPEGLTYLEAKCIRDTAPELTISIEDKEKCYFFGRTMFVTNAKTREDYLSQCLSQLNHEHSAKLRAEEIKAKMEQYRQLLEEETPIIREDITISFNVFGVVFKKSNYYSKFKKAYVEDTLSQKEMHLTEGFNTDASYSEMLTAEILRKNEESKARTAIVFEEALRNNGEEFHPELF